MSTEREVLHNIINDHPEGIPGLFERHSALFYEGLKRFFSNTEAYPDLLAEMIRHMREDLKAGRFDDVVETFYDWVVRNAWSSYMKIKIKESGGEHLDPEQLYLCGDRLSEAELDEETREAINIHLSSCGLCRELLEQCKEIPVEVRHAGAPCPEAFEAVLAKAKEKL
ncbi:MAG: hypothetical protein ABIK28_12370 [Planctomycetota bacterium]